MKLVDLFIGQRVVIQMTWGEQKIEFFSNVIAQEENGIIITPYMHHDSPLELNVDGLSDVVCNLFASLADNNQRRSWKNVELKTVNRNKDIVYFISTKGFNHMSKHDDRRKHDRMIIHKQGKVYDAGSGKETSIMIHDVSDIGISFFTATSYQPRSNQLTVVLVDKVNNKDFSMKVECSPVRRHVQNGMMFWGCRTIKENKDYLLYCFLVRMMNNKKIITHKEEKNEMQAETVELKSVIDEA